MKAENVRYFCETKVDGELTNTSHFYETRDEVVEVARITFEAFDSCSLIHSSLPSDAMNGEQYFVLTDGRIVEISIMTSWEGDS